MISDDVDDRLSRLREEWPVASITENVMARVRTLEDSEISPRRPRRRALAAAALAAVCVGLGMAWIYVASTPSTLMAAVQDSLARASSAHLILTQTDEQGKTHRADAWYRRDHGFRIESPEGVLVDDGKYEWSWAATSDKDKESIVIRQPSDKVNFARSISQWLAFPDVQIGSRTRQPEADRTIGGVPCQALIVTPPAHDPDLPRGSPPAPVRMLVLADAGQRVHEITVQVKKKDTWHPGMGIRVEYDVDVPLDRVALRLPDGARVIDPETAFTDRYPLDKALARMELGGLLFGVHDVRPLKDGEGFYVVSSVRGTPEYLKRYPPARRRVNMSIPVMLEVAFQPRWKQLGDGYDRITLAEVSREDVQFAWWLIIPRRFFMVKGGKKEFLTAKAGDDADRLDQSPGKVRIPLEATYFDKAFRDKSGAMQSVFKWVEVPLPSSAVPEDLERVAGRVRREILVMVRGNLGCLFGVASQTPDEPRNPRAISGFDADRITDADFTAAIQRAIDDMRAMDERWDLNPGGMAPGNGEE
jgi:hypothetical protein